MRGSIIGWAAAGLLLAGGQAGAAPLTATYSGVLLGTDAPFTAVFRYDSNDLTQDGIDPTLFNGRPGAASATLDQGGASLTFGSDDYFYERVITGASPDYEFGIRQSDGAFLLLKLTGDVQEGNYGLANGDGADLDPLSVTIAPAAAVAPVPLPPALAMFAGALLMLGAAGMRAVRATA